MEEYIKQEMVAAECIEEKFWVFIESIPWQVSQRFCGTQKDILDMLRHPKGGDPELLSVVEDYFAGKGDGEAKNGRTIIGPAEILWETDIEILQFHDTHMNLWDYEYTLRAKSAQCA